MKLLLVILLLAHGIVSAAERPEEFAFAMTIQFDGQDALYEVEIPAALYRGVARADLGDVRVFNGQGEVVPHALRPRVISVEQAAASVRLPVFPLYGDQNEKLEDLKVRVDRRADGTIIDIKSNAAKSGAKKLRGYLLDASALTSAIHALRIDWARDSSSFIGQVTVQGSDNLTTWRPLAANAALARLEFAGHKVEREVVELGSARFKYLRLSWPADQTPLASIAARAILAPRRVATSRVWEHIAGSAVPGKPGEYGFDLGGHFPIDRLRVELPQVNSLVQLELFSRAHANDAWRPLLSAVAYRLRQGNAEVSSPEIALASPGERYWLLRVDQKGGGVGSGVPSLQIGWVAQKLVFAARGPGPFQLAYGSARAKPAAFAIATIIPGYKTDAEFKVKSATLGEPRILAGAGQLRASWDYKKITLWSSLIFGVGLLALMAYRLSRQLGAPTESASKSDTPE